MQTAGTPVLFPQTSYGTNGVMTVVPQGGVRFSNKEVALVSMTFYNCFKNISAALNNNKLSIQYPTWAGSVITWHTATFTFADGFYAISDMNLALQNWMLTGLPSSAGTLYLYNPTTKQNIFFIQISANSVQYQTQVDYFTIPTAADLATAGWTIPANSVWAAGGLDTTAGSTATTYSLGVNWVTTSIATMLGVIGNPTAAPGYNPTNWNVTSNGAAWSSNSPVYSYFGKSSPLINPVTSIFLRCNLVSGGIQYPSDIFAQVPVTAAYGASDQFQVSWPYYSAIIDGNYDRITISFMDQNLNILTFFDPEVTVNLLIRDKA